MKEIMNIDLSKEAGNRVIIKSIDLKFYEMGYIGTFSFSFLLKFLLVNNIPTGNEMCQQEVDNPKTVNFCHFSKILKAS